MKSTNNINISGWWEKGDTEPKPGIKAVYNAILDVTRPFSVINMNGELAAGLGGITVIGEKKDSKNDAYPLLAYIPSLPPENLGDPEFKKRFNLCYAYVVGAMANGITSVEMVEEAGRAGMIGFFGAAGLELNRVEDAIVKLKNSLQDIPFGFNLIHSPNNPEHEYRVVQLYLKHKIQIISASAYMDLTLPLILFRVKGICRDKNGDIVCPNKVIAKVSRIEVAEKFFSPPPDKFLSQLLEKQLITNEEAELARQIPTAESLTAEADSGGHTDNRPAVSLLPTMLSLCDRMIEKYGYKKNIPVGLGGGISTPASTAAAFAMGASYVLTGSVNQSCIEAGTSETVRQMLAQARQADVIMAPCADMFEMGVKVQVLKRGTMFPLKAAKLYDLYCRFNSFSDIPESQRSMLEKDYFKCSFSEEWEHTKKYFEKNDPKQIKRAEKDPKHKMALVFRSYIGRSSSWSINGDPNRRIDYQIWCGPAMGAFNEWIKGSFLEKPENRKTVTVAMNLLFGASVAARANWLSSQGVILSYDLRLLKPHKLRQINNILNIKI